MMDGAFAIISQMHVKVKVNVSVLLKYFSKIFRAQALS